MCLEVVSNTKPEPSALIQSGWKHFGGTNAAPTFEIMNYRGSRTVPLNEWLVAEGKKIKDYGAEYKAGFHVYCDEDEIRKDYGSHRRVYYRQVHTRGHQHNKNVVIATEIYVPSNPNAWPPL